MRIASSAAALGALLILAGLGGCRGATSRAASAAPAAAARASTPAFSAMQGVLREGAPIRERGDAGGLRALSPRLANTGLALIKAGPPHDLKRAHVARYQEGRAFFGGVLKQWVAVVEAGDDAAVLAAYDELTDAYYGWLDASQGLAPARSI